ncbi:outer membrane protein assembly factor BamE [Sodaliphilus sp.]|uniref:outer membrane protein assembly factor BamE domain-containing protein n=1 Tax=Sodaliphilus sp. TaxID=2815818 RepID=UPI0038903873
MKKIIIALAVMMSITATSCIATRSTTQVAKVEVGMDKNDVRKLLGQPETKNGDLISEQWVYRKMLGEIAEPVETYFLVNFNADGKVIAYQSIPAHRHMR